jgi:RNA polymerase sigma-70 factor (sigma-E family)
VKPELVTTVATPPGPTFEQFFASTWPFAYRLAVFFTQDREAGEEIAQEVMTRLYATWASVDRPEAYLRTAIVNTATNWHRRNHTQRTKLPLVATPEAVDLVADELADAIAGLPFRQRAVVLLRYYADLSEAEIAEALGCRPGTVKSLASRALNKLSKELPR